MQISYTLLRGKTTQGREIITNILATRMICFRFINYIYPNYWNRMITQATSDFSSEKKWSDKAVETQNVKGNQRYKITIKGIKLWILKCTLSDVISMFRRAGFVQFSHFPVFVPSITHG